MSLEIPEFTIVPTKYYNNGATYHTRQFTRTFEKTTKEHMLKPHNYNYIKLSEPQLMLDHRYAPLCKYVLTLYRLHFTDSARPNIHLFAGALSRVHSNIHLFAGALSRVHSLNYNPAKCQGKRT